MILRRDLIRFRRVGIKKWRLRLLRLRRLGIGLLSRSTSVWVMVHCPLGRRSVKLLTRLYNDRAIGSGCSWGRRVGRSGRDGDGTSVCLSGGSWGLPGSPRTSISRRGSRLPLWLRSRLWLWLLRSFWRCRLRCLRSDGELNAFSWSWLIRSCTRRITWI